MSSGTIWGVLLKLEELQDEQIAEGAGAEAQRDRDHDEDKDAALELLKIRACSTASSRTLRVCGVVGEETNKKVGYLAAVSRLFEAPLAVIVQSSSAAGKSSLMDAVLA